MIVSLQESVINPSDIPGSGYLVVYKNPEDWSFISHIDGELSEIYPNLNSDCISIKCEYSNPYDIYIGFSQEGYTILYFHTISDFIQFANQRSLV